MNLKGGRLPPPVQHLPQLENTREADEYWADLDEDSLFANDFIMSKFAHLRDNREFESLSFLEQRNDDPYKFSGIVEEDGKDNSTESPKKADISHFFKEILYISAGIANSSFASVHYKRTRLLRRIQEAWWRQSQREKQASLVCSSLLFPNNNEIQRLLQPAGTIGGQVPKGLKQSIDPSRGVVPVPIPSGGGLFEDFTFQQQQLSVEGKGLS